MSSFLMFQSLLKGFCSAKALPERVKSKTQVRNNDKIFFFTWHSPFIDIFYIVTHKDHFGNRKPTEIFTLSVKFLIMVDSALTGSVCLEKLLEEENEVKEELCNAVFVARAGAVV